MGFESSAPCKGVALVTGAAGGIGRTIALRLAHDGYDVALNDLVACQASLEAVQHEIHAEHPGRRVCLVFADVSVEEDVKRMVDGAVKVLGRLDVMVANAGIMRTGPLLQATGEDMEAVFRVNVFGTFFCYKYAAQTMVENGIQGRIIGASSLAGKKGFPFVGAYCASKFAIRGITQTAAIELGGHGITVNAYAPGLVETPMLDVLQQDMVRYTGDQGGIIEPLKKAAAVGGVGMTKDVANLVSFLASPEARYVTGQTISVDGGIYFD